MLVLPAWKYAAVAAVLLARGCWFRFLSDYRQRSALTPTPALTIPSIVALLPTPAADPKLDTITPLTVTAFLPPPLEADTPEAHLRLGLLQLRRRPHRPRHCSSIPRQCPPAGLARRKALPERGKCP